MIYYFSWIMLVVLSLWAALVAFVWAFKSGQFSDQQRARYLALSEDLPLVRSESPPKRKLEAFALLSILAMGFLAILVSLALSLYRMKG
jgi:cbb3-type cytochrome oxidase maturation protein